MIKDNTILFLLFQKATYLIIF